MNSAPTIALLLVVATTTWVLGGALVVQALARRHRRAVAKGTAEAVTVLKPLSGLSPDLQDNLQSFFRQQHPNFQLVFGVERPNDPAIPVVQHLLAAHPKVRARLVVAPTRRGQNPKVSNLLNMLEVADHDLLVISDAGVRVEPGYLSDLVATKVRHQAGLVTSVFVGIGERNLGAALENVQLNGFVAAGAALPTLLRDPAVVGKSMLFSRRELEGLGGLERVADLLAEDFVIGKMFQHAGRPVHLARQVVASVNGQVSVTACLDRQLRWSMMRWRLRPLAFLLEPLTSPLFVLPWAWLVFGASGALAWALALVYLRDLGQWLALRGRRGIHWPLLLAPLREVAMLGVWMATPFVKVITWRGHRVRLGAGTMVFATGAPEPQAEAGR